MAIATSRIGYNLREIKPDSYRVPAKLAAAQFGANTLVGINPTTGYAEPVEDGTAYKRILLCVEEIDTTGETDGSVQATHQLVDDATIICEIEGATDADLFSEVYAVDHKTVSKDSASDSRGRAGVIVEVISATRVRVRLG